jgi:hypothetical protein
MEGAGPKVILDRLKEDWQETTEAEVDEEVSRTSSYPQNCLTDAILVGSRKTVVAVDGLPNAELQSRPDRPKTRMQHRQDIGTVWQSL